MIPEFFGSECGTLYQGTCTVMGRVPGLLNKWLTTVRIGVEFVLGFFSRFYFSK